MSQVRALPGEPIFSTGYRSSVRTTSPSGCAGVLCENSRQELRGLAVVELEDAAEPLTAFQRTCSDHLCLGRDEFVAETLVRTLLVVMVYELLNGSPEMPLAERDDSRQALGFGGEDEPFRIGVEVGTSGWQKQRSHAAIPEHAPEGGRVKRVPIEDDVAHTAKEPVLRVG